MQCNLSHHALVINQCKAASSAARTGHDKTHGRTDFVRTPGMEKTVKDAKQLMSGCKQEIPEEECLKIIFGADYFWNK